jgi:hypothetical protein
VSRFDGTVHRHIGDFDRLCGNFEFSVDADADIDRGAGRQRGGDHCHEQYHDNDKCKYLFHRFPPF